MAQSPDDKPIGTARLTDQGVLVLQLRAEAPDGTIGDALLQYAPDHPEYSAWIEHLGGINPGETKSVPPWPSND